MALPRGQTFYIGLYREIVLKSSYLKPQSLLFKKCPWGRKWPCPGGHMFYIGLYRENMKKKIFLPETKKARVLVFGM